MLNISSILPSLSIRNKLLVAFVGLSLFPVAIVGLYGILSNVRTMNDHALENLYHSVASVREKSEHYLESIEGDLRFISNLKDFRTVVQQVDVLDPVAVPAGEIRQLENELLSLAETKPHFFQLRLLNRSGTEVLRVEALGTAVSERAYRIVPPSELRDRRETFYFHLIRDIPPHSITFTPAEVKFKDSVLVPVLSFVIPVWDNDHVAALFIANTYAADLFDVLESPVKIYSDRTIVLLNDQGDYLYHSKKKNDWNKLLASRDLVNLYSDFTEEYSTRITSVQPGTFSSGESIVAHSPLFHAGYGDASTHTNLSLAVPLYVFESVPRDQVLAPVRTLGWTYGGLIVVFLFVSVGLGLLATRQLTHPIKELQRGSDIIAGGTYGHRLEVSTGDELEILAKRFNVMAESLERHEVELQNHRQHLEHMVRLRTQELVDEKSKLQTIVDNVPSAFVLIDPSCRIMIASASFALVTGRDPGNVVGQACDTLFCNGLLCSECMCRKVFDSGLSYTHVDEVEEEKGGVRYLEHSAIPMRENGTISAVLEIISDITQRKQLQEDLVRTERLMAAGEMSAIIAHEFRNALTSVKMIVQLQGESKNASAREKSSLGVALSSLEHMEQIVSELLNFSRPGPLNMKRGDFSGVVKEALTFVSGRIQKLDVAVHEDIDKDLPPVLFDEPRWKEAIINMLLNSLFAIEQCPDRGEPHFLRISLKQTTLKETLKEKKPAWWSTGSFHDADQRIPDVLIIREGTDCLRLEIADSGEGIPEVEMERVFDPFVTLKMNGTGLGLSLVKRTVNAHGGVVSIRSAVNKGTTISITVPTTDRTGLA